MPTIDLGAVVGPQGPQGATGPQGPQGAAGPNSISAATQTALTGVLVGDGGAVRAVQEIVTVSIPALSALPVTVQNAAITADHVLLNYHLSNSRAALGDWTVHCADGSVTVSGYMSSSIPTALTLVLGRAGATI